MDPSGSVTLLTETWSDLETGQNRQGESYDTSQRDGQKTHCKLVFESQLDVSLLLKEELHRTQQMLSAAPLRCLSLPLCWHHLHLLHFNSVCFHRLTDVLSHRLWWGGRHLAQLLLVNERTVSLSV